MSIVNVVTENGPQDYVALASPDVAFSVGLRAEAVVGMLRRPVADGGTIVPDNFIANPVFVKFLASVIAEWGPADAELRDEATRIGKGSVVVIDRRTPTPEGPVPPDDILGAFIVEDGKVGAYLASPNHRLLTDQGFFRLNDWLKDRLRQALAALAGQERSAH